MALHLWPSGRRLGLYAVDRGSIPGRVIPKLEKFYMSFPYLGFSIFGKSM